jgi:hypothetical protein
MEVLIFTYDPQDKEPLHRGNWRIVSKAKTLDEFKKLVLNHWNEKFEPWVNVDVYDIFHKNKQWGDKLLETLIWHYQQGNIKMGYDGGTKFCKYDS